MFKSGLDANGDILMKVTPFPPSSSPVTMDYIRINRVSFPSDVTTFESHETECPFQFHRRASLLYRGRGATVKKASVPRSIASVSNSEHSAHPNASVVIARTRPGIITGTVPLVDQA